MDNIPDNYVKLFNSEECTTIIECVEKLNKWDECGNGTTTKYKSCDISDIEWIYNKFIKYVKDVFNIDIISLNYMKCFKYETGDLFEKHVDYISEHRFYGKFMYNINVVLNDDFDGGKFIVNEIEYPIIKGYAYHYTSNTEHQVTEVVNGIRYSILFPIFADNIKRNELI